VLLDVLLLVLLVELVVLLGGGLVVDELDGGEYVEVLVELLGEGLVEVLVLVVVDVEVEVDTCGCAAKLMNCSICG
jgi:hypothetical protein